VIAAEGICFDLDGTLVDSAEDLIQATAYSLKALGLEAPAGEEIIRHVGGGARGLLKGSMGELATKERVEVGLASFMEFYGAHLLDHTRAYPGVREVLERFSASMPLAVVTNKPDAFTLDIIQGLGMESYFKEVVGYDGVERKKPHPEGILKVLGLWGVEPHRAVMVGDSSYDVLAGKAAGTITVAVTYGFKPRQELEASEPDYLIDDIRELIDLVPI
jgi:phosphoglycolate phosphatase